jgi:hypothetical protein
MSRPDKTELSAAKAMLRQAVVEIALNGDNVSPEALLAKVLILQEKLAKLEAVFGAAAVRQALSQ